MPKKSSIRIFDGQIDKKNNDSKSKSNLKNSDQKFIKDRKSKKSIGLFNDSNIKEEDIY